MSWDDLGVEEEDPDTLPLDFTSYWEIIGLTAELYPCPYSNHLLQPRSFLVYFPLTLDLVSRPKFFSLNLSLIFGEVL